MHDQNVTTKHAWTSGTNVDKNAHVLDRSESEMAPFRLGLGKAHWIFKKNKGKLLYTKNQQMEVPFLSASQLNA